MLFKSTARLSHAGKIVLGVAALSGLVACGGGSSSGTATPAPVADVYVGKNCGAVANGSSDGYVLGVCDVVTEPTGATGPALEDSNNSFQLATSSVGSSKASSGIADLSGKSFSMLLNTSLAPISPATTLNYPADFDPCTYYFSFDASTTSTNRGLTLTKLINVNGRSTAQFDITSFASAVPGINGPAAGQTVGPCGNTGVEPSLAPVVQLTDFDFGVLAYYVGAPIGKLDPSYYGGWYSRVGNRWTTPPTAGPVGSIAFDASKSRVFGHYSTPERLFNTSITPSGAQWANNTLTVTLPANWGYFNLFASSSTRRGTQTYSAINPKLPAMVLTGSYNPTTKKVEGQITSAGVDLGGKFEGEFNAAGTEFAGRMTVKVGSTGVNARMSGAFALRQ